MAMNFHSFLAIIAVIPMAGKVTRNMVLTSRFLPHR